MGGALVARVGPISPASSFTSLASPSVPSGRTTTQEMAPIFRAMSSDSSTMRNASCLCGIVRLHPANSNDGSARSASFRPSGRIASGT